jgi:OHCU decarboxylase
MRANPADFALVAPCDLRSVLALLAEQPGAWLPIAGGTDVMVQYAAGALGKRKLVSIWNLPELRRIEFTADEIRIGAACTYTDLRKSELICREFSLLANAASWTGGIANQNRGTLGGNIVNASPAADSLPALLVYEAELILMSARGERRMPCREFHVGYRKTQLAADELIHTICLKRAYSGYYAHARKVGPRNAQAISKVCLAGLGKMENGVVKDARLAMGSVAPVPLRLFETEGVINESTVDANLLRHVKASVAAEIRPIDDIRSTARYRAAVAGNLVCEFLQQLSTAEQKKWGVLERWNALSAEAAAENILPCCGSRSWAYKMAERRPIRSEAELLNACNSVCASLADCDWDEAFRSHPRIGESHAQAPVAARSASWSGEEQRSFASAEETVKRALAEGNREYEGRFQRIFVVCATGKPAAEILAILRRRMANDPRTEFLEATEQQRQITHLRLKKWLSS